MWLPSSFTRWGLLALPVSGLVFVVGYLISGALPDPQAGAAAYMTAFGTPRFTLGAFINLAGMLLDPFGFFALYGYLIQHGPSRTALGAMFLNVLGLEMTLTGYGVIAFDLPLLARFFAQGKAPANVGFDVATSPVLVVFFILSGLVYVMGSFLFSVALWRRHLSPKWVPVGFTLSALFLCFGPLLPGPTLWNGISGSLLLFASGGWLAWHHRYREEQ